MAQGEDGDEEDIKRRNQVMQNMKAIEKMSEVAWCGGPTSPTTWVWPVFKAK